MPVPTDLLLAHKFSQCGINSSVSKFLLLNVKFQQPKSQQTSQVLMTLEVFYFCLYNTTLNNQLHVFV